MTAGTGLVDAVSFLSLERVFTANMTGNVVFLAFATGRVPRAVHHAVFNGTCVVSCRRIVRRADQGVGERRFAFPIRGTGIPAGSCRDRGVVVRDGYTGDLMGVSVQRLAFVALTGRKGEALLSDGQPNREYGAPRL